MSDHRVVTTFVALLAPLLVLLLAHPVDAALPRSSPTLLVPSAHDSQGFQGGITLLATQPQSDWFATLGTDDTICIWDAGDGHFLAKHPAAGTQHLAILPRSHLALVSSFVTLSLLDVDTFTIVKSATMNEPMVELFATPDGRLLGLSMGGLYRFDPTILATKPLAKITAGLFERARLSPDGNRVAVVTSLNPNLKHLSIFDTRSGATVLSADLPGLVYAIDLNSELVIIGTGDGHLLTLHLPDGKQVADLTLPHSSTALLLLPGHLSRSYEVLNAYPGGNERLDLKTGRSLQQAEYGKLFNFLARSGTSIIGAGQGLGAPSVCDVATLKCSAPTAIHGSQVTQVKALGDNGLLLLDSRGNAIRLAETLRTKRLYLGGTLALLPRWKGEEGLFAVGQNDWVNNALAPTEPSLMAMANPVAMAASSDGHYLVTRAASVRGSQLQAQIHDLTKLKNEPLAGPPQVGTWVLASEQSTAINVADEYQFGFTPDSSLLLAINLSTGTIHRYDMASAHELPVALPPAAAKSPFGFAPARISAWSVRADGSAIVLARDKTLLSVPLADSGSQESATVNGPVESIASGAGAETYIALEDGSVLRWSMAGPPVAFTTLSDAGQSMLYVAERNWLMANCADGSTRFLDARSGRELMSLMLFANGRDWLLWTPDGLFDASDGGWSGLRWKFSANTFSGSEPVEDFYDQFYIPGLAAAVLGGTTPKPAQPLAPKDRRTATLGVTAGRVADGKVSLDLVATAPNGVAVRDIHLFRNGVLLKTWSEDTQPGRHLKLTVDLVAGPNRFRAYAFNQSKVKTTDAVTEVTGPAALTRPGELYVVAIGINDYKNAALHLNYARQDAQLAAAALRVQREDIRRTAEQLAAMPNTGSNAQLEQQRAALKPSLGAIHVTTLLDADATRERILKTLVDVSRQVRAEDALVIYYAGHGIAVGDRYYLLPQDLDFAGAPSQLREQGGAILARSAISDTDLTNALAGEQAATAALIIDACQSGEVVGDKLAEHRGPADSRGLAQLAYDKRMYILAASLSTQSAAEQQGLEHGVLTYGLMMQGLMEDRAASGQDIGGVGTTIAEWLDWAANNIGGAGTQTGSIRGFEGADVGDWSATMRVQQPRLFAPPASEAEPATAIAVAQRALLLDPLTLTTSGFSLPRPGTNTVPAAPAHREVLFRPSTLGPFKSGVVSADGHEIVGMSGNRVVAIDLQSGAVRWSQRADEDLVSVDISSSGEVATLGQSGQVSITTRSAAPDVHKVVEGIGYTVNGLVRWLGRDANLLVVTDRRVAVYTRQGAQLGSVDLTNAGVLTATLSGRGDLLYILDASGKVLTYQVPSLTPGAVVESAQTRAPGPGAYWRSLVVDPAGQYLIRVRSDGLLVQTRLPQTAAAHPLIQADSIQAARFSADGSRLFVADSAGMVLIIDTASGQQQKSWPSGMAKIESLATDAAGTVLVAMGGSAISAWSIPGGAVTTAIPGGSLDVTVRPEDGGSVTVMIADVDSVRSFHWPDAATTSLVPLPQTLLVNHDRLVGAANGTLSVWEGQDLNAAKKLSVPNEGMLRITPNGKILAWLPASPTASVQVFDASRGAVIRSEALAVNPATFELSPDGSSLFYLLGAHLHQVPVTGGPTTDVVLPPFTWNQMQPSADGAELLLSSLEGQVVLYDLRKRRLRRMLLMHAAVESMDFVPSSDEVVVVTQDGDVHLWKTSTAQEPLLLGAVEGQVTGVGFTPSGSTLLVGTNLGRVGWFSLGGVDQGPIATSTWVDSTHSWLTVANDGRFDVAGDLSTPVGVIEADHPTWQAASLQPGFTPGLLKQLAAR